MGPWLQNGSEQLRTHSLGSSPETFLRRAALADDPWTVPCMNSFRYSLSTSD